MKNFYFNRNEDRPLETLTMEAAEFPQELMEKIKALRAGDKLKIKIGGKEFRLFQCLIGAKKDKK